MSFHNVTCCTNYLLSCTHFHTTKLLNIMCTLTVTKCDIMHFRVYLDHFLYAPTSCRIWSKQLVQYNYQIQDIHVAICLIISKFIWIFYSFIKVKIFMLVKWSYMSPQLCMQLCWPLNLTCFSIISWARSLVSFRKFKKINECPFLDLHLITHHPDISVQIIAMLDLGTSTIHMF